MRQCLVGSALKYPKPRRLRIGITLSLYLLFPFPIKIKEAKPVLDGIFYFMYTSYRNANIHKMFSRGKAGKIGGFF